MGNSVACQDMLDGAQVADTSVEFLLHGNTFLRCWKRERRLVGFACSFIIAHFLVGIAKVDGDERCVIIVPVDAERLLVGEDGTTGVMLPRLPVCIVEIIIHRVEAADGFGKLLELVLGTLAFFFARQYRRFEVKIFLIDGIVGNLFGGWLSCLGIVSIFFGSCLSYIGIVDGFFGSCLSRLGIVSIFFGSCRSCTGIVDGFFGSCFSRLGIVSSFFGSCLSRLGIVSIFFGSCRSCTGIVDGFFGSCFSRLGIVSSFFVGRLSCLSFIGNLFGGWLSCLSFVGSLFSA